MSTEFDDADFVDRDFDKPKPISYPPVTAAPTQLADQTKAPPSREELERQVSQAQQQLAELKRAQDELERQRSRLEESRRRRAELQTGRQEILQELTRGLALLEEAEFALRRDAEQMTKTLTQLREAMQNVESIQEQSWTVDNWNQELTRALTSIENARMEWNAARLKWPLLDGETPPGAQSMPNREPPPTPWFVNIDFLQLCRIGIGFTWPVALVLLVALIAALVLWLNPS